MLRVLDPVFMTCTMLHASIAAFVLGNRDPGKKIMGAVCDRDALSTAQDSEARRWPVADNTALHSTETLLSSSTVWYSCFVTPTLYAAMANTFVWGPVRAVKSLLQWRILTLLRGIPNILVKPKWFLKINLKLELLINRR